MGGGSTDFQRRPNLGPLTRLRLLDAVICLEGLKVPPGNRLEPLRGDRSDQWGIRINGQWYICFSWDAAPMPGT